MSPNTNPNNTNNDPSGEQISHRFSVPPLIIDNTNLFFDDDSNHLNDEFNVEVSGLPISNGYIEEHNNNDGSAFKFTFYHEDKKHNLDLSFKISDKKFMDKIKSTKNEYYDVNFILFSQKWINLNYNSNSLSSLIVNNNPLTNSKENNYAEVTLTLRIKPFYNEYNGIKERVPLKYIIDEFVFNGTTCNRDNNLKTFNSHLEINSASKVYVKSKPVKFSFSKITNLFNSSKKTVAIINSNYSSNVFDDSNIIGLENNYSKVLKYAKAKANEIVNKCNDTLNIDLAINADNPFVKTIYDNSKPDTYRTKGSMILRYGCSNKYCDYLEVEQRTKTKLQSPQKELVTVSLDNKLLKEKAKTATNFKTFLNDLRTMEPNEKRKIIQVLNVDNGEKTNMLIDVNSIRFNQYNNQNQILVTFNFVETNKIFYVLQNRLTITHGIQLTSANLNIPTFNNVNKVSVTIDGNKIKNYAQNAINYQDFQKLYGDRGYLLNMIKSNNIDAIDNIYFVDDGQFLNRVTIKITLKEGYTFFDELNTKTLSVGNINWKGQHNVPQKISIDFDKQKFYQQFRNYSSLNNFLEKNNNSTIENWVNYLILNEVRYVNEEGKTSFYQTKLSDLHSIHFQKINKYNRRIKVQIQANEWRYFDFPGSTENSDCYEFEIGNLLFENETESELTGLNIEFDWPYFYQTLLNFYKDQSLLDFKPFINEYEDNFLVFNNNEESFIKVNPYINYAINPAEVTFNENGINVAFNLNDGFYWSLHHKFDEDCFLTTYNLFISIDQIKQFHDEMIKPNPKYMVSDIRLNTNKIQAYAKETENIEELVKRFKNPYEINELLIFDNINDIYKIDEYSIKVISKRTLSVNLKLFDKYYFQDLNIAEKSKSLKISNLLFKNEKETDLISVSIGVNQAAISKKANEFHHFNELLTYFNQIHNNADAYNNFLEKYLFLDKKYYDGIDIIEFKPGNNENSLIISVTLKEGYYFINKSPLIPTISFTINNLLFSSNNNVPGQDNNKPGENNPDSEHGLIKIHWNWTSKPLVEQALNVKTFKELKEWFYKDENYWKLFTIDTKQKKSIKTVELLKINEHTLKLIITLNGGYYFDDQPYYDLQKELLIGNVFYLNQSVPELKKVDINFNQVFYYYFIKEHQFNSYESFIEEVTKNILNFTDNKNAILTINIDNQDVFNKILVQPYNDGIQINLQVITGYYIDDDNPNNIQFQLNYSKNDLSNFYNLGKKQENERIFNRNLIIILCTTIPFAILIIIIIVWTIAVKRKNRGE